MGRNVILSESFRHVTLSIPGNVAKGQFQLRKTPLSQEQEVFEADATVSEAASWAESLLQRTYRGPGDTIEAASYRAEQKYGVPANTFWALRYRKPSGILAHIYLRLKAAYEAECERQEARLRHELDMVKALPSTPAREALVAETEAALGTQSIQDKGVRG